MAPRQVIDTYLIESSPKTSTNLEDIIQEDTLANTSNRKRKALMLQIENVRIRHFVDCFIPFYYRIEIPSIFNLITVDVFLFSDVFENNGAGRFACKYR